MKMLKFVLPALAVLGLTLVLAGCPSDKMMKKGMGAATSPSHLVG